MRLRDPGDLDHAPRAATWADRAVADRAVTPELRRDLRVPGAILAGFALFFGAAAWHHATSPMAKMARSLPRQEARLAQLGMPMRLEDVALPVNPATDATKEMQRLSELGRRVGRTHSFFTDPANFAALSLSWEIRDAVRLAADRSTLSYPHAFTQGETLLFPELRYWRDAMTTIRKDGTAAIAAGDAAWLAENLRWLDRVGRLVQGSPTIVGHHVGMAIRNDAESLAREALRSQSPALTDVVAQFVRNRQPEPDFRDAWRCDAAIWQRFTRSPHAIRNAVLKVQVNISRNQLPVPPAIGAHTWADGSRAYAFSRLADLLESVPETSSEVERIAAIRRWQEAPTPPETGALWEWMFDQGWKVARPRLRHATEKAMTDAMLAAIRGGAMPEDPARPGSRIEIVRFPGGFRLWSAGYDGKGTVANPRGDDVSLPWPRTGQGVRSIPDNSPAAGFTDADDVWR